MSDFLTDDEMNVLEKSAKDFSPSGTSSASKPNDEMIALPNPPIKINHDNSFISDEEMNALSSKEAPSSAEILARGAAQGVSFGFAPEITGALESLKDVATTDAPLKDLPELYQQRRNESETNYKTAQEENPLLYGGAELASGFLIPGIGTAKAAKTGTSILSKVLRGSAAGSAAGGLSAAGHSEADLIEAAKGKEGELGKFASDVGSGMAVGGVIGGAVPAVTGVISKAASGLKNTKTGKILQEIRDEIGNTSSGEISKKTVKIADRESNNLIDDLSNNINKVVKERKQKILDFKGQHETSDVFDPFLSDMERLSKMDAVKDDANKLIKGFKSYSGNVKSVIPGMPKSVPKKINTDEMLELDTIIDDFIEKSKNGQIGKSFRDPLINLKKSLRDRLYENVDIKKEREALSKYFDAQDLLQAKSFKNLSSGSEKAGLGGANYQSKINQLEDVLNELDPNLANKFMDKADKVKTLLKVRDAVTTPILNQNTNLGLVDRLLNNALTGLPAKGALKLMKPSNISQATEIINPNLIQRNIPSIRQKIPENISRMIAKPDQEKSEYSMPISNKITRQMQETQSPALKRELERISSMPTEKQSVEYYKLHQNEEFRKELEKLK